jgi:hypothetical protein
VITSNGTSLIIDRVMPDYDATKIATLVAEVPAPVAYTALRTLDLFDVHSPLMDAAMWVRGLPMEIARRRRGEGPVELPPTAIVGDLFDKGSSEGEGPLDGWMAFGEEAGHELCFGAVGDFFHADFSWKAMSPDEFPRFSEPGYGKIAADLTVRPFGQGRSLMAYEARVKSTDPESRRKFRRYWLLTSPFIGVVLKATLRTAAGRAIQEPPVTVPTTSPTG